MHQKINTTLLEVRKAYRLLYNYQDRVLDLVSFIGSKYGFRYNGGYSKFSHGAPRNGKGYLTNWAWDWLNMYYYEFNFAPIKKLESTIYFSVFIVNDTGFFDARDGGDDRKTSRLDANSFKSAEMSKSELIFVVGKNFWLGWGDNWDEPEFISQTYGKKQSTDGGIMLFKHYSLEMFENEDGAMNCLRDFERYCTEKGIEDFKIKEGI